MDESEYRTIDVDPAVLVDRLGGAQSRDLAVEFPVEGWQLVATITRHGGNSVSLVFRRSADVVDMSANGAAVVHT